MRVTILALIVFFLIVSASAEENRADRLLRLRYPLTDKARVEFDKIAIKELYREDCKCLAVIQNGKILEIDMPLSDNDRRQLLEGFRRKILQPFGEKGRKF